MDACKKEVEEVSKELKNNPPTLSHTQLSRTQKRDNLFMTRN